MRIAQTQFGPAASAYLTSGVHSNEASLRRLVAAAKPSGGRLLDVGTGAGHTAFAFARHVDRVVAADITSAMLEIVRAETASRGVSNVAPCFADAEQLPFRDGAFEGLVCRLAAHHFDDPRRFVREARRVVRSGGWFLMVDNVGIEDPEADDELDRIERLRDRSHVRNWTESQWREWVADAGFVPETLDRLPKPINALDWLERMRVGEGEREEVVRRIVESEGWLRDYLRPHGEGSLLTFHLHELLLLAR